MVGARIFLEPQRPEVAEKRVNGWPAQSQITVAKDLSAEDPLIYRLQRTPQEQKWRPPRGIQNPKPPTERGRICYTIGIFNRRCRRFPGTALYKVAPQRLTAGDQAVMRVGGREPWQESNRLPARSAHASPNLNPVLAFVMSLFAPAAVAHDRVDQTNRASAHDHFLACLRPVGLQVVLRRGK
jgi:hypothetical protein